MPNFDKKKKTALLVGGMDAKKVILIMLFKHESHKKPGPWISFLHHGFFGIAFMVFLGHAVKYYSKKKLQRLCEVSSGEFRWLCVSC